MRHINAIELRQSLGKVVQQLENDGEPVVLDRGKKPVAVLISLKDFHERFVEKAVREARLELARKIDELAMKSQDHTPAEEILRNLRGTNE